MPWPMVHFAISNYLYTGNPSPSLLIGSIAPDAIHVRGQISREEKGITHLIQDGQFPSIAFIMGNLKEASIKRSELEWKDFILGYFTHIYTDVRWTETIYADFERATQGDNQIRSMYNQEVSQVEFEIQRSLENDDEIMELLIRAEGFTIDPYITQQEVNMYRDQKVEWLREPHNEPKIKPIYFNTFQVNRFIEETAKEIKVLLKEYKLE